MGKSDCSFGHAPLEQKRSLCGDASVEEGWSADIPARSKFRTPARLGFAEKFVGRALLRTGRCARR